MLIREPTASEVRGLEGLEIFDEVAFFLVGEAEVGASVVAVDHVEECLEAARSMGSMTQSPGARPSRRFAMTRLVSVVSDPQLSLD